jgi:fluoride exporter
VPLDPVVLALVFAGGCAGGLARYGLGKLLPGTDGGWPWGVLTANTTGAFLLAGLLVTTGALSPAVVWLRPALGTGFCGAFTTMAAVAVFVDEQAVADLPTAAGFLAASMLAGLAAALLGVAAARGLLQVLPPPRGSR